MNAAGSSQGVKASWGGSEHVWIGLLPDPGLVPSVGAA